MLLKSISAFEEDTKDEDIISRFDHALKGRQRAKTLANIPVGMEDNLPSQVKYALRGIEFALQYEEPKGFSGRRIQEAVEKRYIRIAPKLSLLPIFGIETLIHYGALLFKEGTAELTFDNLHNLRSFGVFGNPLFSSAIYLQQPNSDITQNSSYWCKKDYPYRIDLVLDARIILGVKPIYLDPETILPNLEYDTLANLGQSYFILGGIPKEAIISYRFPNHSALSL